MIITLQYSPEFTNVSADVVLIEGGPVATLECTAGGEPTPNITYCCTASNGIGTASNHTVAVDVNYKPENVQLLVNDSTVCKGDDIRITCSADGKPAVHTYHLYENEIPVSDGDSSAGVRTRKYLKEGNFSYRCVG